ncbi:helix-turn-helix domain-containing protein [uncultured Gilvimarinus sp.]|mgnify:FL=1|uniref:helix-turn-helix domain-containing protein n=1 Tax=uncultured Gilvimarinus sp. TaxID=1689143 RepID=UPI0030EBAF50|tara:strand:- start:817 stop:1254 length:438 start_codon:yes stop_codon:yes gene_type:complete
MIQLQRLNPQVTDEDGFSRSGIRSYHEYVVLAKLPEVEGVSDRVLEALQKRVGHAPMAIEHIADDLNLSKRTLQRRLQQQGASFAQLRDSLRFHYAIKYLIDDHMSVDSVSSSLDFSDRTSFTNAFKRWTNLSPSVFRKLFRDYA